LGETLSINLAGVPSGATLSAGIHNADGSWTLAPAQLSGLTLMPPAGFSGTLNLTVTAQSDVMGTSAVAISPLTVSVSPVADAPTLSVMPAAGIESQPIALNIAAALVAPAAGETLSVDISGVPTGTLLSAGIHNADGSWTLTSHQLVGLTVTPPTGANGTLNLTITAQSSVAGTSASTSVPLAVAIAPVAQAPIVSVANAVGNEDTTIALHLGAALPTTATTDILAVTISGVPAGATLSSGTYAGNGNWAVAASELPSLTITPPMNYNGTMALMLNVTSFDGPSHATVTMPFSVTVAPIADLPSLIVSAAVGLEDTAIPLAIAISGVPSEVQSLIITGLPSGASLSAGLHNADGSWTLTPVQLPGLTLTPAANSNADFTLHLTATSTDGGRVSASISSDLLVTVTGVPDVPTVSSLSTTGAAGTPIPLSVRGTLADTDGSETLSYVIHGLPDGFALTQGSNNGDNTWTLTSGQLTGLKLVSPPGFNGKITLYATSVSHEDDAGSQASAAQAFTVGIGNVASGYLIDLGLDANVGGIGAQAHVGAGPDLQLFPATGGLLQSRGIYMREDTPFLLQDAPSLLGLPVLNGVTALVSRIILSGLPTDALLSAGQNLGNGTWSLTQAQLTNLYLTPGANSDANFTILSSAKLTTLATVNLTSTPVNILGIADQPTLSASATRVSEGQPIPLSIAGVMTDTDGSETLSYSVSHLPAGSRLSAGIDNGNGSWSLSPADLVGLKLITAPGYSGTTTMTVSAISTEREGDQAVTQATVVLNVTPVASGARITAAPDHVTEGSAVPLHLAVMLNDVDGSETLTSVLVSGLPEGSSLMGASDNHNGTWSVDMAHLTSVKFVPAIHFSGVATLTVSATTTETANGASSTSTSSVPIQIDPVATAPSLDVHAAYALSNGAVPLAIAAALNDTDGSETLSVLLSGMPDGSTLSAGLHNADGSWSLTGQQLVGLTLTPPAGTTHDFSLSVTALAHERAGGDSAVSTTLSVTIIDPPSLILHDASGSENTPIALSIGAALVEPVATESLSVTISGMPSGATLSAGVHNSDGNWVLPASALAGLTLTPPTNYHHEITLAVTAVTHESVSGLDAATSGALHVAIVDPLHPVPHV
jgi:hypothetical protein